MHDKLGDNGQIHRGNVSDGLDIDRMKRNQTENAQIHLIHDFGVEGEKFLLGKYGQALIDAVLKQRAEMQLAGGLFVTDEAGKTQLNTLNVNALGVSDEDLLHAQSLKARRGIQAPRDSHAADAEATVGTGFAARVAN